MRKQKIRKRKRIIAPRVQTVFCIISFIFIVSCLTFYGYRLVKYYKIYNPKAENGEILENLSSRIISNENIVSSGDGLYNINGSYLYKGIDTNNYILISNMLFRIIKINKDKTIDVVLDEYINKMEWDLKPVNYFDSVIYKYLKDKFLPIFNEDILVESSICDNEISDLTEFSCENSLEKTYVRLINLSDYLNSLNDNKTYLNENKMYLWLNDYSKDNIWNTTASYISSSSPTNKYGVKPVLTLKNSTVYITGDGSLNKPYIINRNNDINVGTYLDINDDVYIVYEVLDNAYKVQSNRNLSKPMVFDKYSNDYTKSYLKEYLEDTYLDKLSYKDLLKEVEFDNYSSKIGILNQNDFKFNNFLNDYFLSDKDDDSIYVYNSSNISNEVNIKKNVRICLGISKDLKIISGNGSKISPFIVEA